MVIWKTAGKKKTAGGFERLADTKAKEQARLLQHSSCKGDTLQPGTAHVLQYPPLGGRSHSSRQGVRLPPRLQSSVREANSASSWKTNREEILPS